MFGFQRIGGRSKPDPPTIHENVTLRHLGHAEAGQEQVELTHALQTGDTEDFAFSQIKARIVQLVTCL